MLFSGVAPLNNRTQTIRMSDSFEVPYLAGDGHALVVVCAAIRIGGESLHSGG